MASRVLPPLPKALRSFGAPNSAEGYRRIDEWAGGQQRLVQALRDGNPSVLSRLDELEAQVALIDTSGGGVTDHGALTGLGADDHTQYLRTDGTRALTGDQSAGGHKITDLAAPTNPNDAVRLTDVPAGVGFGAVSAITAGGAGTNGVAGTAARSDHVHPAAVGAPSTLVVGGGNTTGTSSDFAAQDHIHALPAFGSTAGTFAEGNDARLVATADYRKLYHPDVETSDFGGDEAHTSALGSYTAFDPRGYITWAHDSTRGFYTAVATGDGTTDWGVIQLANSPAPTEFCMIAKVSVSQNTNSNSADAGLYIGTFGGANTLTCRYAAISTSATATAGYVATAGTINGTTTTGPTSAVTGPQLVNYIRMRVNGGNNETDCSMDGVSWIRMGSGTNSTGGQTNYGLIYRVFANGSTATAYFHWVRVISGSGTSTFSNVPVLGRMLRAPIP